MSSEYKKILPEDVYITIFDRESTESELRSELSKDFSGNRPSGNDFIDFFASLVRAHQFRSVKYYAKLMGLDPLALNTTISVLTGIGAKEWCRRYVMLTACELLLKSEYGIGEISSRLGFSQVSVFSHFFLQQTKERPSDWQRRRRGIRKL